MAQWMKAADGIYVNLHHAVRVRRMQSREHPGTAGKPRWVWGAEMPDGELVETTEAGWDVWDVGDWLAHIVPAQPGQEMLVVSWDLPDAAERPTKLWITRLPIVAWRVELRPDLVPTPVTPDELAGSCNCRQFIVLPDGRLLEQYNGEFENLEAMKADLLAAAQREWDNAQAAKAKAAAVAPAD